MCPRYCRSADARMHLQNALLLDITIIFILFLSSGFSYLFFNLLNFYSETCFLVTPLLVTVLLCLVTPPKINCDIDYYHLNR